MWPFESQSGQSESDLEKQLDELANSDWRKINALRNGEGSPASRSNREGSPESQQRQQDSQEAARTTPAGKPKQRKKAKPPKKDEAAIVIGGIELVEYVREDGTPGVVLRPKGRKRGVPFRKGDWALFAAFCNTIRSAHMDAITKAVAKQIG